MMKKVSDNGSDNSGGSSDKSTTNDSSDVLSRILSADDFQAHARRVLDKGLYDYFASGTDDGTSRGSLKCGGII